MLFIDWAWAGPTRFVIVALVVQPLARRDAEWRRFRKGIVKEEHGEPRL
jgi:hypothetical protein